MNDLNFCTRCGTPLERRLHGHLYVATCTGAECGQLHYRNAKPCAGVLIEHEGAVLLAQRNIDPFRGCWDIPGGYLDEWEHPAEGARREAREETGLEIELIQFLGIYIDSYGSEGLNTFNVYYRARSLGGTPRAADDVSEVRWFTPADLPGEIAFPGHIPAVLDSWQAAVARDPHPDPAADPTLQPFVSPAARAKRDDALLR